MVQMRRIMLISIVLAVSVYVSAQTPDKELFQDAESRFMSQDYELALDRYEALLREYPLSQYVPDVQFRRAVSLYRLGKYEDSLGLFRRIESRYRSTRYLPFVPFWIGVVEYAAGEYEHAVDDFTRFLALEVDSELVKQALLYKGMSEASIGRNADAKETLAALLARIENPAEQPSATVQLMSLYVKDRAYQEVIGLYQSIALDAFEAKWRARIVLYAAEALYANGEYDQARTLYEGLLQAEPEVLTIAYQRLFMIAHSTGNAEESRRIVGEAEKALAGKPGVLKEFWLRVGIQSYGQGKYDLAEYYFQRVWDLRKIEEVSVSAPLYLAELKARAGELGVAAEILEEYLSLGADRLDLVLLKLGELYVRTENWKNAEDRLERFLLEFPDSQSYSLGSYLRAYALYRSGSDQESLAIIQKLFAQGKTAEFSGQLLRLKAGVLQRQGNRNDAIQTLREYASISKNDVSARIDLLKLLFADGKHPRIIEEVQQLYRDFPNLEKSDPAAYLLSAYIAGLSQVSQKNYAEALSSLQRVTPERLAQNGLENLTAHGMFYRGWTLYRLGRFKEAVNEFSPVLDRYPGHELSARSAYLAGWCSFSLSQYEAAEQYLARLLRMNAAADLREKAAFLTGKSQVSRKRYQEAAITFQNIFSKTPDSAFADDAAYEYAGVLFQLGKTDDALAGYYEVFKKYTESPLRQEALYKRGEILFNAKRYREARDAFYEFRSFFPKSTQFDAALYWGGLSSEELAEQFGAIMLWEQIVSEYRTSPFRPDAMHRTAEIYAETGEFRKALNLYTELIAAYPKEASGFRAEQRAEELRYLLLGLSDREAELSVTIGREGGAKTEAGRKAILDLSRLYIYEGGPKQDLAVSMLSEVISRKGEDPASAAQAKYLMAEYTYRKGDPVQAATVFLEAAALNPGDKDLMAMSIYRSAEMMKVAGRRTDAELLVRRLEQNFPASQWAVEGKKLLEDRK